jgi:DNA-binding NarL/FixJ family response regulator
MTGGTLMISRAKYLLPDWKKDFEDFGFQNILTTSQDKDALNWIISDFKPKLVLIGCGFYDTSTPFMMGRLLLSFPKLNIAAVNIHEFPAERAIGFIANGVKSYVDMMLGREEFHRGLAAVRDGQLYVSPNVMEKIKSKGEMPMQATELTLRQTEVARLLCNGYMTLEIADVLHISERTVHIHKRELYNKLNVRNENELIRVALFHGIIKVDELKFYGEWKKSSSEYSTVNRRST